MARSVNVKPSAREESKSSGGEEQTTVMSRALLPFPARRASSPPPRESESARSAARSKSNDDKTVVDFVRPGVIQDERTLVAPFLLPKSTRQTLSIPRPSSAPTPTTCDLPVATRRASSPPPLPPPSQALANPRPALIPPPPPSATKLHQPPPSVRPSAPPAMRESRESMAPESSPALVSDVVPLPPAPASKTRREPMLLLAAGMGVLGMIFTLGIVVGLVVSLRSPAPAPAATLGTRALPVAAAAGGVAPSPIVAAVAPPVATPVVAPPMPPAVAVVAAIDTRKAPEAPKPSVVAVPVNRAPRVAAPAAPQRLVAAAVPAAPSPKRGHAASSDPDLDAANAASLLARAQLEASLR